MYTKVIYFFLGTMLLAACSSGGDGTDSTPPVITLVGSPTLNLMVGSNYSDPGVNATDNVDGDVTDEVVIAGDAVNTDAVGAYEVTYDVCDAAGNCATQVTRTVNVATVSGGDTTAPEITLQGGNPLYLSFGSSYTDPGVVATDNVDGDITDEVVIAGDTVNTNSAGTYVVTYNVSDAAGNPAPQMTRTVTVISGTSGPNILTPAPNELKNQNDVEVRATASGFPQNWRVDFVLDGRFNNAVQGTRAQGTDTWFASLGDLSKQTHTLTAIMVDENDNQQSGYSDEISFDVGDYYVAFGDSISEGIGDDFSADNQSQDGRNNSRGYTPILNDLLTANKGYPHSVVVEGIGGYTAGDGLLDIDAALAANPESSHFLIQFGTNDSAEVVLSGLGKQPGDGGYPGTFKDDMQQIIDKVQSAGKIALLAKAPILYADCSVQSQCQSYVQRGISPPGDAAANGLVREYNEVVDELIQENGLELDPVAMPGVLFVAPDLYGYFEATGLDFEGKSPKFFDWLHPNGVGYQDMAVLWRDALLL